MKSVLLASSAAAMGLALALSSPDSRAESSVQLALEDVVRVEWRRLDNASRYAFHHGDRKLGSSLGNARFFVLDPAVDWSEVHVEAQTLRGEPVGETEIVDTRNDQRLVVRWNETEFDTPFLGVYVRTDTRTQRGVQGLREQPHVIPAEPESVQRVLFGEAVDRPDRRQPFAPFSFDNGEVERFGPFEDLDVP